MNHFSRKSLLLVFILLSVSFSLYADKNQTQFLTEIPAKVSGQIDPKDYFNVPFGVAIKNNVVYVTDLGNTRIVKLDQNTLQYLGEIVILEKNGKFKQFLLGRPAFDKDGNLWVSDMENDRILKIEESTGKIIHQFGSYGDKPGEFHASNGLAFDDNGALWVADELNSRVQKCDVKNGKCQAFSVGDSTFPQDLAVQNGFLYVCVTWENKVKKYNLANMQLVQEFGSDILKHPRGIALDNQGKIYVADNEGQKTVIYNPDGSLSGIITSLKYNRPAGIKVDNNGNIYQAQAQSHFVLKYDANKVEKAQAGKTRNLPYQLYSPLGTATNGTEYAVCDMMNHRIQVYNTQGLYIKSIGPVLFPSSVVYGKDNKIYVGAMAYYQQKYIGMLNVYDLSWNLIQSIPFYDPATQETFIPARLIQDDDSNLLSSDYINGKLYKISTQNYQIIAKYQAKNANLAGIASNKTTIYVADSTNDQIIKLDKNLNQIGQFGKHGYADGEFFGLLDLAIDSKNTFWIADSGNFRIQAFGPNEKWILSIGDLGLSPAHFFGLTVIHIFNSQYFYTVSSYLNFVRSIHLDSFKEMSKSMNKKKIIKKWKISISEQQKNNQLAKIKEIQDYLKKNHKEDSQENRMEMERLLRNTYHSY